MMSCCVHDGAVRVSDARVNRFLAALRDDETRALIDAATRRDLAAGDVVVHRGDRVEHAYFPLRGAIAEIEEGLDGETVEVTVVGPEGVSGIEALLDKDDAPFTRVVDVPTVALAVPVGAVRAVRDRFPAVHELIHRYAAERLRAAGISIGCNARHPVGARLARWLLRMCDRVGMTDFELTHETIARMLGVQRPTVTRAIAHLEEEGAVDTARGSVRVLDRLRLEALACSCYPESRELFDVLYRAFRGGGRAGSP